MGSHGIKDRVAIVGMACTRFAEHFDKSLDDLLLEATEGAYAATGVDRTSVDAYWFGTAQSSMSGLGLARAIGVSDKPITRVENFCATGSEASTSVSSTGSRCPSSKSTTANTTGGLGE